MKDCGAPAAVWSAVAADDEVSHQDVPGAGRCC